MKKVYIHTDLEGVSGIDRGEMIQPGSPEHRYCIERLMADTNAAVDGAFLGGAQHVTVLDSHGGGHNFDLDLLDKRAMFDTKPNGLWWASMDETYSGTLFIGAHAMAGTLNGFLDHTQDSLRIYNYAVNGRRMGELGQWAMVCGHFGVPLIMVSGDEAAAHEATQFFGDIETAAVKRGVSRQRAVLVEPAEALERIRLAAKRAVERVDAGCFKPFKPLMPMGARKEYMRADYCDASAAKQGVERLDARAARMVSQRCLDFMF